MAIHNEGAVGTKPAKLIAIYMVEKGQPLVHAGEVGRYGHSV